MRYDAACAASCFLRGKSQPLMTGVQMSFTGYFAGGSCCQEKERHDMIKNGAEELEDSWFRFI